MAAKPTTNTDTEPPRAPRPLTELEWKELNQEARRRAKALASDEWDIPEDRRAEEEEDLASDLLVGAASWRVTPREGQDAANFDDMPARLCSMSTIGDRLNNRRRDWRRGIRSRDKRRTRTIDNPGALEQAVAKNTGDEPLDAASEREMVGRIESVADRLAEPQRTYVRAWRDALAGADPLASEGQVWSRAARECGVCERTISDAVHTFVEIAALVLLAAALLSDKEGEAQATSSERRTNRGNAS